MIALTANVLEDERKACLDAGMDDFLSKPLAVPALIQALEKCVRLPDSPREVETGEPSAVP